MRVSIKRIVLLELDEEESVTVAYGLESSANDEKAGSSDKQRDTMRDVAGALRHPEQYVGWSE